MSLSPSEKPASDLFEGHHHGLREIIDALMAAAQAHDQNPQAPQSGVFLRDGLKRLDHFSSLHFADEEKFMDDISYPDRKAHRSQHVAFMAHLRSLEQRLSNRSDSTPWSPIASDLCTWWETHARDYDRLLADFLCRGGI